MVPDLQPCHSRSELMEIENADVQDPLLQQVMSPSTIVAWEPTEALRVLSEAEDPRTLSLIQYQTALVQNRAVVIQQHAPDMQVIENMMHAWQNAQGELLEERAKFVVLKMQEHIMQQCAIRVAQVQKEAMDSYAQHAKVLTEKAAIQ